ncbi:MAG: hypothetical protein JSS87_00395 [Acidobacteria bacterium]|nr:hypothetical protein [Acidobacteriota bacterium]
MPFDLALYDLVSPYLLRGDTFGKWHAALSVLYVSEHTLTQDDAGITIRGVARFSGDVQPYVDPTNMTFGVQAENTEGHPENDAGRRDPWLDLRDAHIEFELSAPRTASAKVTAAVLALGADAGFKNAAAVLADYDPNTADAPPSDYPSTEFSLDLLLTSVVLRPPFLVGARLDEPSGLLIEDTEHNRVTFTLPRIKVRLAQGSGANDPLTAQLLSAGAAGLDGNDDLGVAQLVTMDPPYAFIGPSKVVGIGFRSATLDLSADSTPPDVLSQFGYDDAWTGLYLPELRLYVAPPGADDLAFDASATNLLIGFGESAGVTGDFELAVINQGSGEVKVSARFYDVDGKSYAITRTSDTEATVTLPKTSRLVVDIDGGLTPYFGTATIGAAAEAPGRLFDVDFGAETSLVIVVSGKGSQPGATKKTLTITAALEGQSAPAPAGTLTTSTTAAPDVNTTGIVQGGKTLSIPRLKRVNYTTTQVTVAVDTDSTTAAQAHWTIGGVDKGVSAAVTFDCKEGDNIAVIAELPEVAPTTSTSEFTAYFRFDHPAPGPDNATKSYAEDPDHTHTAPAPDQGLTSPWAPGMDAASGMAPLLTAIDAGAQITIKGYASFETGDDPSPASSSYIRNNDLARRRALGLRGIFEDKLGVASSRITHSADMSHWNAAEQGDPTRNLWWKAVASWDPAHTTGQPKITITGTATRKKPDAPGPVPPPPDTKADPPAPPSWFKKIDAKVRIVRDHFVACEVSGQFDIQTATENQLATGGVSGADIPQWKGSGSQNPADGIVDARVMVQIDDATDTTTVDVSFGADPADKDGLMHMGWLPPNAVTDGGYGQDFLGLGIAFMPLVADIAASVAKDGGLAELAVTGGAIGVIGVIAGLPWFRTEHIIWYGGEVGVQVRPDGTKVAILFDLEVGLSAEISLAGIQIVTIPRESPLLIRYKALGIVIGHPAGEPGGQFRPVFDASKGYSIDVSKPGAIQVHSPFDKILKILGARLAHNNPFMMEVDLGFAIDLGVVSIDRARVRMHLSPPAPPELTAFGASVDIPGALSGSGFLEMNNGPTGFEIKGGLDLTITPVCVRVAATFAIAQITSGPGSPATGVQVSLEVDFPVAIPLACSGLGIYGLLGLFAVNYARDESIVTDTTTTAPALAWLKATGGEPQLSQYWAPKIGGWAFGVGALLGTQGSDFLFNLKGIVLLELPGPRLLLMMKANLLADIPGLHGPAEGTFLAVVDLDFGRGTLTIGLAVNFDASPLLSISIPVEAFFNFNDTSDWHLYLGRYDQQVSAKVLQVFDASGYLMLSGSGIPAHNNLPAVTGFSIGTGLHVSFKWGGGPLYAQLSAGFDAVVGFSPFRLAGIMEVRGTLHLFIIDISAWAQLTVDVGDKGDGTHVAQITGKICGRVKFFFFSVSGCVSFTLSADFVDVPDPPPLAASLKLVSRSPALVAGSGADKPIDVSLGEGQQGDTQPGDLLQVPVDAIPVVMMSMPPLQDGGIKFLGTDIGGTSHAPADGWVQRGDLWYKYTLHSVELIGTVSAGPTPATWWNTKAGDQALEAQLALLSWIPNATPKAFTSSKYLDETVTEQWGTVCSKGAPPAAVLWTFFGQRVGPSETGWLLTGTAQPDPPDTVRSSWPSLLLRVTERWCCGNSSIDNLRGIIPAEVDAQAVACAPSLHNVLGTTSITSASGAVAAATTRINNIGRIATNVAVHTGNAGSSTGVSPAVRLNNLAAASATATTVATNPTALLRGNLQVVEKISATRPAFSDVLTKLNAGQSVSRSDLLRSAITAVPPAQEVATKNCTAYALASPLFDDGKVIELGNPSREKDVLAGWKTRKFKPGKLDDAVVFSTGAIKYGRFMLWVPLRLMPQKAVIVAVMDADENILSSHVVTNADLIGTASLPTTWTSTSSPWHDEILELAEMGVTMREQYAMVFVEIGGSDKADRIVVAATPESRDIRTKLAIRPFYVACIETLGLAEMERSDYDNKTQQSLQSALGGALTADNASNALLVENTTYQVRINYSVSRERRKAGQSPDLQLTLDNQSQSFWFATDGTPPDSLRGWILAALPGEREQHYFSSDTIRLVFGTTNLWNIYDAYGKKLQVRLRPSGFQTVPSTPSVPHPLVITPEKLKKIAPAVLSPWEEAVNRVVLPNSPCVPGSGETVRHTVLDIPIPLELYTDYLIDVEMLDKATADGTPGQLVWRSSFSTGGFHTADEFASSFSIARIGHRGVPAEHAGALQAIGLQFAAKDPEGAEFDNALINAGLDALPLPKAPGVTVFWEATSPPTPSAILLDASEPMWRMRPLPSMVTSTDPAGSQRYEMLDQLWMDMQKGTGSADIIDRIVPAPGGQRALITLKPGARGQRIVLALRYIAHKETYLDGPAATDRLIPILDCTLATAPWEEED